MDRMLRVNELLKRELGELFERHICSRVSNCLVTVTDIRTAPDLRNAIVYVSVYGSEEKKAQVARLMVEERVEFQRQINRRTKLKYTPILEFRFDELMGKADHLFRVLDELAEEEGNGGKS